MSIYENAQAYQTPTYNISLMTRLLHYSSNLTTRSLWHCQSVLCFHAFFRLFIQWSRIRLKQGGGGSSRIDEKKISSEEKDTSFPKYPVLYDIVFGALLEGSRIVPLGHRKLAFSNENFDAIITNCQRNTESNQNPLPEIMERK